MPRIVGLTVRDVRFPTSRELDGSDAMNPDPDYSAAYVTLHTDGSHDGAGLVFTIGRGNDVQSAAISALGPLVVGRAVDEPADIAALSNALVHDSQFRWLGPEKGVAHMAIGSIVNAAWDLLARVREMPVWLLVSQLSVDELLEQIDFRYLSDALSPDEARGLLEAAVPGREQRIEQLLADGYPAYTTSPGWLGYDDDKMVRLAREAVADGFAAIKLKVGGNRADDVRRLRLARDTVGDSYPIAIDANQRWDVAEAVDWLAALAPMNPWWIEEPTSPDDVLGHAAIRRAVSPMRVATGEHVANRVVFKQLLQADAIDVVQVDAARVGGLNENLAILLLAAKFGRPVCPHAGGVGLCELVQHVSMIDFVAVSASMDGRMIEYVDHLHEHFVNPAVIRDGRYVAPRAAGFSAEMWPATIAEFEFPQGPAWSGATNDRQEVA
jgi:L-fuconate dehydratase